MTALIRSRIASLYLPRRLAFAAIATAIAAFAMALPWLPIQRVAPALLLALALAWASWVDIYRMILPDIITLGLVVSGVAISAVGADPAGEGLHVLDSATGALMGYALPVCVAGVFRRLKGYDGLGRGDAKLFAASGAWVGANSLPYILLISSVFGVLVVAVKAVLAGANARVGHVAATTATASPIPFGPMIAVSLWWVWLVQQAASAAPQ